MIYVKSVECIESLDNWISDIELKLKKYPPGEIFVSRNGKHFKWLFRESKDSDRECISKKKRDFAKN